MSRYWGLAIPLAGALLTLAGLRVADAPGPRVVSVDLSEYRVETSAATVPAGRVRFDVRNTGRQRHELVVLRTSLPVSALPERDGRAVEDAAGVVHVGEIGGLDAGRSGSLTLDLGRGGYLLVCNLPGHLQDGMATRLTVT